MKPISKTLCAVLVVGLLAATAYADITLLSSGYSGNGINHPVEGSVFCGQVSLGVTNESVASYDPGDKIKTFCIEASELINWNTAYAIEYSVAVVPGVNTGVAPFAWKGGLTGGMPDYLDKETAWLYTHYLQGDLSSFLVGSGYSYADTNNGNEALQKAIWYSEGEWVEKNADGTYADVPLTGAAAALYKAAEDYASADDLRNVGVLNLGQKYDPTIPVQSFLIWAPGYFAPPPIPAPAAIVLGALGLGLVGWSKKRLVKHD